MLSGLLERWRGEGTLARTPAMFAARRGTPKNWNRNRVGKSPSLLRALLLRLRTGSFFNVRHTLCAIYAQTAMTLRNG